MAEAPIDKFSLVHAGVGAAMAAWGFSPQFSIGSHIAFEALEDKYIKPAVKDYWPQPEPDSIENHAADVAFFIAGYYGARKLEESDMGKTLVALGIGGATALWILDVMRTRAGESV